jgi:hypothetical protein
LNKSNLSPLGPSRAKLSTGSNTRITKLPLNVSPLDSNGWLTGFTEADGDFGVSITESKPKSDTRQRSQSRRVRCRFTPPGAPSVLHSGN